MFYTVAVLGGNEPGRDVACSRNDEMNFAVLRRACTSSVIEFLPRALYGKAPINRLSPLLPAKKIEPQTSYRVDL